MKIFNMLKFVALGLALQTGGTAAAQVGVLDCEFTAIVPDNADFFTSNFRPYPVVGTRVQIDFSALAITSMVFEDGRVFFAEGDATLNRLRRFDQSAGFGGVRQGNQGFYIGYLAPASKTASDPETFTSRFAITNSFRGENFHLETVETHYGDLECKTPNIAAY